MNQALLDELKTIISGDVMTDEETIRAHSTDKSIYEVTPQVVVYPKDSRDVQNLVAFLAKHKAKHPDLSVAARAAGTDMSGGDLSDSIVVSFTKYFNHEPIIHDKEQYATVEPGMYYRDFEKYTLQHDLLYPPYPSSRMLCAMGGIVNNNAGGEKSLQYGKAEDFVQSLQMVLADGKEYTIKPLTMLELHKKMKKSDFEGKLYRRIYNLIDRHYDLIMKAKPNVSKNSAGYYLWNVYDKEKKTFDLTKLFVGAQGTLGIMTSVDLKLVPVKKHAEMLVIYVDDYAHLAEIVNKILPFNPESLETYDDYTLDLALKYYSGFGKKMGTHSSLETFMHFLPEFKMKYSKTMPKLTIQAEFTGDSYEELTEKINLLKKELEPYKLKMKVAPNEKAETKYWEIRRDSFALLSTRLKERYSCPFIDDVVVNPEHLPEFLPKYQEILHKYPVPVAMQGHVGNGNFHVFPLIDLRNPEEQKLIPQIAEEVFDLVAKYGGSTSGEHNDGIVRTPYLNKQFNKKILTLFAETKKIFDPKGIFNPGKKVNITVEYGMSHLRKDW